MPKITKRTVDAATTDATTGRRIIWDTEIKGFGLLVLPSGVKSYIFDYRTPEGRKRRITIGKHGTFTPDEARRKADDHRRAVNEGRDPLGEKVEQRNAPTVGDLLDAYLKSERFANKAPSTQAIDRGRIERHLRPLLGRKHVHALKPGDVERALADIRDGKTATTVKTRARGKARVTGGAGTARMAIDLLRSVFRWAQQQRLATSNPCEHVRTGGSGTRDAILESVEDFRRLFAALDKLEAERQIRSPAADAIRVIALTGARRGEIAGLRWQHVDLKRGLITLPPHSHKSGRKTGKPRIIGLPAAAQAIVARQPEGQPDDFVFSPAKGNGAMALSRVWYKVRAEAELPQEIGLHALRHSLGSHMAMQGAEAAEIMTALGHRQLSTTQRYIHWARDARQALAERAASVALAGLEPEPKEGGGSVVSQFPRKGGA